MFRFAELSLLLWPVVVLFLFERQPVRKAIVTSFVAAWLFLPPIQIPLPGFPDWSKTTATVVSVLLALLMKQPQRLLSLQPRWFDLPVLGFCVSSLISAISMGVGIYEGFSSVLVDTLMWGLPYLIGRAYLADEAGSKQLVTGFAVGGLLYVPLCLLEIRFSPKLKGWVYGFQDQNVVDFGLRYGGYRPTVFLATGLEVGWWMCCASLCAYLLIASRTTRRWFNLPAVPLAWILTLVTVACKSTGALVQVAVGLLIIATCRLFKNSVLFWLLLAIPPLYCLARPSGYCSGDQILSVVKQYFPPDRIQSLEFRFFNEDYLIGSAWQHPILGWTRNGGFNPVSEDGKAAAITDGYWIIVFCCTGSVGLVLLNAMLLLPSCLFLRRYPVRIWKTTQVAPLLALAVILPLYMVDNLSNAMLNPIYAVAMGVLAGASSNRRSVLTIERANEADHETVAAQHIKAIAEQARIVRARPYGQNVDLLASLRAEHARCLADQGELDLALAERSTAEELWHSIELPANGPNSWSHERLANANDLAWLLVSKSSGSPAELAWARQLIEAALAGAPDRAPYWNTLGIVCYRQQQYHRAIHALTRSVTLNSQGGTAFDFYFLALANKALGYDQMAATWRDRGDSWRQTHSDLDAGLAVVSGEVLRAGI